MSQSYILPVDISPENFNEVAAVLHGVNLHWWHDAAGKRLDRNKGELLCLMHSELSEAAEGVMTKAYDDHLTSRRMEEVEMGDTVIRIGDYAGAYKLDIGGAIAATYTEAPALLMFNARCYDALSCITDLHLNISRAMEGERKSKNHAVVTGRPAVEVELAIAVYKIWRYCDLQHLDLVGAIREKVAYNAVRQDHTHEARAQANGKKW